MNPPSIVPERILPSTSIVADPFDAYSLDYLDVTVMCDQEWFDTSRHSKTRVITLGGKGRNAMAALHKWLPPGVDLLLQAGDEQGRLRAYRHSGAANEYEVGDVLAALPSPIDSEVETLFIWAGLGGNVGTPQSQALACDDRHKSIPTFALVTLPFAFEGAERADQAEKSRKVLEQCADACLAIRNEALFEIFGGEADLAKVFALQDQWLAHVLLTLKGLADAQSIRPLVCQTGLGNQLSMGFGRSTGINRVDQAVTAAFKNPLLHGLNWQSKQMLVVLSSGELPSQNELKQAELQATNALSGDCEVSVHGLRDPRMGDDLYATLVFIEKVHSAR